jgi:hypothetical protein
MAWTVVGSWKYIKVWGLGSLSLRKRQRKPIENLCKEM